jgi:beta-lactamase class A
MRDEQFYINRYRGRKKEGNKKVKFTLYLIVLLIVIFGVLKIRPAQKLIDPNVTSANSEEFFVRQSSLKATVDKALEGSKGRYGLVIKNFKTNETYSYQADQTFTTGSLYKLWVMGTVYEQIKEGILTEDQVLTQSIDALNREFGIDPEDAEQKGGGISMPVKQAVNQMITISHNYAALLLTEKVRLSRVAQFLRDNNFNHSKVGTATTLPESTPYDIAVFYEKLYRGEIVDPSSSEKMLEFLKKQQLNDGLPRDLPDGTIFAHKTGDLNAFKHDAGIVYTPKGNYILVVMSESSSPPGAQDRMADLSEAVYQYFNN